MTLEELENAFNELKGKVDEILDAASTAEKDYNYRKNFEGFKERNSEKLGPYYEKMKKLNGDDFDLDKAAFDEYNNDFSDIEEATYVAQLVSEIDNKIAKLKEALDDDHVMIESDGDETKVETHDEVIEAESEDPEEVQEDAEEAVEEVEDEAEEEIENEEDSEEAEFVKELEEEYKKYHR